MRKRTLRNFKIEKKMQLYVISKQKENATVTWNKRILSIQNYKVHS